jgi:hypothetical protein
MSNYLTGKSAMDNMTNELLERATIAQERVTAEYAESLRRYKADRRERIATAALQGVMANSSRRGPPWEAAKIAIEVADELILQLDKGPRP